MTRLELVVAMLNVAAPVVRSYFTDLSHDVKLVVDAEAGSTFLWAPREGGSYIVLLQREALANIRAAELFSAMNSQERGLQWYNIRVGGGKSCAIEPVTSEDACILAWAAKRSAEATTDHVSEVHL